MILNLISPEKVLFSDRVKSVTLPGALGEMTILKNHAPLISLLCQGKVKILTEDKREVFYQIENGIVEVSENVINVLVSLPF
jgi:F-type H+-transporting ATPase subunit epsilon